ncbi:YceI family protein [Chryseobacterium suipulveris]|uniref:YceI family protein n=1 Tax=Chryseobacterium suipulveris TaxID=2929800 RepID=A0ABY4BQI7_9FLAO|nr:YceI family protein [Chryseobacterium suipulveris]UOE41451.1 YceI family protein [Chryseobacterium suipulveris]
MKNSLKLVLAFFAISMFGFVNAQNITGKSTKVAVDGTSPMHDWTMTSSSATFSGTVSGNAITNVRFTMPAKNLVSTKGKMMDNKAYAALKADKNPTITFTAASLPVGKGNLTGKLSIAGVTKDVTLPVNVVKNGNSYNITGTEDMKLSDFGMERPGFMGVRTGDALKITVNIVAN